VPCDGSGALNPGAEIRLEILAEAKIEAMQEAMF
jgi:hypothetical protein